MQSFCDKMNDFLNGYYQANKNSGVLRITLKDEVIYEKFMGYADVENKTEFSKKSMFTLYSLSKPFCAIGLLKLKDKKLIDIDKHSGDYLPEAKVFDEGVTIRHLLNHTSGIPDFEQNTDFRQRYNGETLEQRKFALKIVCPKDGMYPPRETSNL